MSQFCKLNCIFCAMYTRLRLGGKKDDFYRDVVQFIRESNSIIIELSVPYCRNKLSCYKITRFVSQFSKLNCTF